MRIQKQVHAGTGILTRCPSPTRLRLGLGPTNPGMIIMAQETLLFRWEGFSPSLRLLIPAFSLDNAPPNLTVRLQGDINAPLPLTQFPNFNTLNVVNMYVCTCDSRFWLADLCVTSPYEACFILHMIYKLKFRNWASPYLR